MSIEGQLQIMGLDDATRFEHLRNIPDESTRLLFYDSNERLADLEADKRLRNLIISVAIGLAPALAFVAGIASGVRLSFGAI